MASTDPPLSSRQPAPAVDPEMQPILEAMLARRSDRTPISATPPEVMRRRMAEDFRFWNEGGPTIAEVRDFAVPGPHGEVGIRCYDPAPGTTGRPAFIYLHGGGWVVGSPATEDRSIRELVDASRLPAFSVDYHLAPENPFPSQVEECTAVARWLHDHAADFGVDARSLGLGGASAGANLALSTALKLRDEGGSDWLKCCVLLYGAYARHSDTESHRRFGRGGFGLTTEDMNHFWSMYVGSRAANDVGCTAEPLHADLGNLPPVLLIAAALDPLLDDSLELHERLQRAGVPSQLSVYPGVVHGFTVMLRKLSAGKCAMHEVAGFLQKTLTGEQ